MSSKMVTVATFGNPIEAELAKNRLRDEGIQAHLLGDTGGSPFAGVGGLFGQMSLLVAEADAERAGRVLAEEEPEEPSEEGGSTAIKAPEWSRADGTEEDDPEARYRTAELELQSAKPVKKDERIARVGDSASSAERMDGSTASEEEEGDDLSVSWKPDDYAGRAWKAAVIGIMLLPFSPCIFLGIGVLLYSVALVIYLAFMSEDLTSAGLRRLYGALAAIAVGLGGIMLLFLQRVHW